MLQLDYKVKQAIFDIGSVLIAGAACVVFVAIAFAIGFFLGIIKI